MAEKMIEEKSLSIEDYLGMFESASADFQMVQQRSAQLDHIEIRVMEAEDGNRYEDTTFFEKSGVRYTVRAKLP